MKIGNLEMVPLSEELIPQAQKITDRHLGKGLYTADSLMDIMNRKHHYFSVILDGEKAVAVFYCLAGTADDLKREYVWIPYSGSGTYGILRSIAIEESYRKIGLSEQLIDHFTRVLFEEEHAEKIAVLAWVRDEFVPAAFCLKRCGYSRGRLINRPWYDTAGLKCNFCGREHCICDGIFFEKEREASCHE